MISFILIPFLSLLVTLFAGYTVSAAPSFLPHIKSDLSKRSIRSHTDPTSIRHSTAQKSAFLQAHNVVRARHNAAPLTWSLSLARLAEQWADTCQFKHTNGILRDEPYGENIVAATGNFPVKSAVATFVEDESQFDPHHSVSSHFTQVVWKSTTELGCAVSTCGHIFPGQGPAVLYVCLYSPAGNVLGEIAQNVQ